MNNIKIICFDLKSVIKEDSWLDLNLAMGMTANEHDFLHKLYLADIMSYSEWIELLSRIYMKQGATRAEIEKAVHNYTYQADAKATIRYLREKGYELVLLSGAMNVVVDKVAAELGIRHAGSTTSFMFNHRGRLVDTDISSDDETSKLAQLELIARQHGYKLQQCACLGDGDNDAALFKATRHGIALAGSPLENQAWRVIKGLGDLKEIF